MRRQTLKRAFINTAPASKWSNKNWVVLGDSISVVTGLTEKFYHEYIQDSIPGLTVYNHAISGTGYYCNVRSRIYQVIDSLENDADLITIFAGTNDWNENGGTPMTLGNLGDTDPTESFYGAVDYTLRQLVTKYPTKTIAVFTPLPRDNNWGVKSTGVTLEQVADAIKRTSHRYSIPVLDLYNESNFYAWDSNFNRYAMPDGLHPNANGHKIIANKVLSFLNSL
ncbi:SGNH/GDSL hydrolase family protein [Paenibacillus sp. NPDC056579]|uniref:SGNH/GDSL hydrolase family protein n=1 Tax=unclassified Paenibacillus TaxID=185978 RepID=UPI001EF95B03|nr:SGNH/GDSL hydrolase family protein [Paenibacillus sp. H1-7]ULL16132.1 SGNH/GDSL hydrolase family protein [Paenibacillus sp. H1-7]